MRVFWYYPWPAQRWLAVAQGVAARNHRIVMQCFRATADEPVPVPPPGLTLLAELPRPMPRREGTPLWVADRAQLLAERVGRRSWRLRTIGTDLCHVHLLQHLMDPAFLTAMGRRQILVSTIHDLRPHHARLPCRVEHLTLRRLYGAAGHLVVHHALLAEGLVEHFHVDRERITVLPFPVFRSSLPVPATTGRSILFFGALRRNKGVAVLLQAMEMIARDDVQLTIAGRGVPDVEQLVREAAARDARITAEIGYVSEERKAELHRSADLVVLPYTSFASQSAVLHDAYSYSQPVLVTDVGALGATVRADGTGWVVPPSDAEALAAAIRAALGDGAQLASAGAAAARVAEERSPEAVGRGLALLYERLTGLGPSEEHCSVVERAPDVAPPVR